MIASPLVALMLVAVLAAVALVVGALFPSSPLDAEFEGQENDPSFYPVSAGVDDPRVLGFRLTNDGNHSLKIITAWSISTAGPRMTIDAQLDATDPGSGPSPPEGRFKPLPDSSIAPYEAFAGRIRLDNVACSTRRAYVVDSLVVAYQQGGDVHLERFEVDPPARLRCR